MAIVTYPGFTPAGRMQLAVNTVSANVALPTTTPASTLALVTNLGPSPAFVTLGTTSALVSTIATGVTILPNQSLFLGVGSNTYLAAITQNHWASLTIDLGN